MTENFIKQNNTLSSSWMFVFFKKVISALMIIMIFFNLAVSTVFCLLAFSTNLFMTHSHLGRWKNDERLVLSFHFVSFVLNVIVFVYNGLKQSHILQTMPNRLLQILFFFIATLFMFIWKIASCAVCGEMWVWVCHYVNHIGLHLLFCISEICINLTRDLFIISRGKKSWQSL